MNNSRRKIIYTLITLYLTLGFSEYWQYVELNRQIAEIRAEMVDDNKSIEIKLKGLETEIRELEDELDDVYSKYDNLHNRLSNLSTHVSALEVEDTEEQIQYETSEGEIEMLAKLIEAEAGNQDFIGKCLVADVVLNRVESSIFPDTIEEVIFEKHLRKRDGVWCYQFSTVKYGTFEKLGGNISAESYVAAIQEMKSERIDADILYFTAGYYNPCCIPAYIYGDHYFGY